MFTGLIDEIIRVMISRTFWSRRLCIAYVDQVSIHHRIAVDHRRRPMYTVLWVMPQVRDARRSWSLSDFPKSNIYFMAGKASSIQHSLLTANFWIFVTNSSSHLHFILSRKLPSWHRQAMTIIRFQTWMETWERSSISIPPSTRPLP